jgi:hypothetical protein
MSIEQLIDNLHQSCYNSTMPTTLPSGVYLYQNEYLKEFNSGCFRLGFLQQAVEIKSPTDSVELLTAWDGNDTVTESEIIPISDIKPFLLKP